MIGSANTMPPSNGVIAKAKATNGIGARKRDECEEPYPKNGQCDIKRNRPEEISVKDKADGALGDCAVGQVSQRSSLEQHLAARHPRCIRN